MQGARRQLPSERLRRGSSYRRLQQGRPQAEPGLRRPRSSLGARVLLDVPSTASPLARLPRESQPARSGRRKSQMKTSLSSARPKEAGEEASKTSNARSARSDSAGSGQREQRAAATGVRSSVGTRAASLERVRHRDDVEPQQRSNFSSSLRVRPAQALHKTSASRVRRDRERPIQRQTRRPQCASVVYLWTKLASASRTSGRSPGVLYSDMRAIRH